MAAGEVVLMSARWESSQLLQPITGEQPCGENLEDTELLASFDAFRLFGQARPLDAQAEKEEKRIPKPRESPEWGQIRDKALEALTKSKDLRLLATLGTALLRTDGVPAFSETLSVASEWLEKYWSQTYPLVDEDAILRRNALNCFADPMAVVDGLRKVPLVSSRQHGTFSLRDIDIATHQQSPGEGDTQVDGLQINAAFGSMPIAELAQLNESVAGATASLQKIDASMRDAAGSEATPSFDPLTAQFARMGQVLRAQLAAHPDSAAAPASGVDGDAGAAAGDWASGRGVTSRQDAIRALDAVADFFRRTEPSSPIPLFLARAKRLVSKDFLEVLADIAPEAVAQARAAGGLKDE
jgi:type VI secretion system protein ImpA